MNYIVITFDNFQEYLGQEVDVQIGCSKFGLVYPEQNLLIGMNRGTFYFKSLEEGEPYYWHWLIEDQDCSIDVFIHTKPLTDTQA